MHLGRLAALMVAMTVTLLPATAMGRGRATTPDATPMAVPVRTADAACGACHRGILESYLKTPMGNASGLAEDRLLPGVYRDGPSGMTYGVEQEARGAVLRYAPTAGGGGKDGAARAQEAGG